MNVTRITAVRALLFHFLIFLQIDDDTDSHLSPSKLLLRLNLKNRSYIYWCITELVTSRL